MIRRRINRWFDRRVDALALGIITAVVGGGSWRSLEVLI